TLAYWTSFINWGSLQQAIAKLCCGTANERLWEALFGSLEASIAANSERPKPESAETEPDARTRATAARVSQPEPAADVGDAATYSALLAFLERAASPDGMARMLAPSASPEIEELRANVAE